MLKLFKTITPDDFFWNDLPKNTLMDLNLN